MSGALERPGASLGDAGAGSAAGSGGGGAGVAGGLTDLVIDAAGSDRYQSGEIFREMQKSDTKPGKCLRV